MRKLLAILTVLVLCSSVWGANRLSTWSNGQVLTHTALNAEFDNIYIGNISRTAGYWGQNDNIPVDFGTSQDAQFEWDTVQTQDSLWLGLSGSMTFIITDKADAATDYAIAASTDPMLVIHSADAATAADYIALSHDQTNAVINVGGGGFSIEVAGTAITTISSVGDWVFKGTTPTLTVGDAGAEDAAIVYDGNAVDFYVGLDDGTDDLYIGEGSTIGSNARIVIDSGTDGVNLSGPVVSAGNFSTQATTTLGNAATDSIVMTGSLFGASALLFEGNTVDSIETIFSITDPTASDKTITFPNATGTVALIGYGSQAGVLDVATLDAATAVTTAALTASGATTLNTVAYTWPAADAAGSGYSLTSNSSGTLSWLDVTAGAATDLDDLGDVTITAAANLEIIQNNGAGQWVDRSLSAAGIAALAGATFSGNVVTQGNTTLGNAATDVITMTGSLFGTSALLFEGSTVDSIETIFAITDPTASDKTITFPNATGTVALIGYGSQAGVLDVATLDAATAVTTAAFTATGTTTLNTVAYTWPGADGSADDVITTNGTGTLSWGAPAGGAVSALDDLNDVTITTGANLDVLQNNGSGQWVDRSFSEAGIAGLAANTFTGDQTVTGTTPLITIGDAGEEDTAILFDGNAIDFYIGLDDTSDTLLIGTGATVGSNQRITISNSQVQLNYPAIAANTFGTNAATTLGNDVDDTITITGSIQGTNALIFEGTTVDAFETIFAITDPTTPDKTITFPNQTGTVILSTDSIGDVTDVTVSGEADHDALYFDTASSDWKNTDAVKIIDTGEVAIEGTDTIWFRATATDANSNSGLVMANDAQQWLVKVSAGDQFIVQDITNTIDALTILTATSAATFAGTVTIGGNYTLPAADGTTGQYLTTNGSGVLTWTSP